MAFSCITMFSFENCNQALDHLNDLTFRRSKNLIDYFKLNDETDKKADEIYNIQCILYIVY